MMRSSFDSQLRQLNNELIEMGALCEEAITLSAKALAEGMSMEELTASTGSVSP